MIHARAKGKLTEDMLWLHKHETFYSFIPYKKLSLGKKNDVFLIFEHTPETLNYVKGGNRFLW